MSYLGYKDGLTQGVEPVHTAPTLLYAVVNVAVICVDNDVPAWIFFGGYVHSLPESANFSAQNVV